MPLEELSQQAMAACPDISLEFAEEVDEALTQAALDGDSPSSPLWFSLFDWPFFTKPRKTRTHETPDMKGFLA